MINYKELLRQIDLWLNFLLFNVDYNFFDDIFSSLCSFYLLVL